MTGAPANRSAATGSLAGFGLPDRVQTGLSLEHARRVAAVLDSPAEITEGGPLPLLWHWAFGTPETATRLLGPDGHPRLPGDGPSAGLPRRMWAGGRMTAHHPLIVGVPAVRTSSVLSAERKTGRSGELLVVAVEHRYEQDGRTAIVEQQDLVYRAPGAAVPEPPGGHVEPAPPGGWAERVSVGPVALFRFSAVTFNAHRIHYDAAYARDVEGYPRLVVHGPLSAMLLAESVRARTGGELREFAFRASAPLFAEQPFTLVADPRAQAGSGHGAASGAGEHIDLRIVRGDGTVAMNATAVLRR